MLLAELSHTAQELRSGGVHTALALHRFEHDAAGHRGNGRFQRLQVIEIHILEPGQQRIELHLHLFLTGGSQCAERATMETLVEGNHLITRRAIRCRLAMPEAAGRLDHALITLRAGIAEEHATGNADELLHHQLRQFGLAGNAIQV